MTKKELLTIAHDSLPDLSKVFGVFVTGLTLLRVKIDRINDLLQPYSEFVQIIIVAITLVYLTYKALNEIHKYRTRNNERDK